MLPKASPKSIDDEIKSTYEVLYLTQVQTCPQSLRYLNKISSLLARPVQKTTVLGKTGF